ncbi:MAG: polysaccharide deacetylase family protein [Clostridia bacterium]|nr:polysaccharide deacetylase family protein [Clostridia bacterium]
MNMVYTCFPGGKHKCLSMSYDDGFRSDLKLVEIFNRNGIRGTFNLISAILDWEDRIHPDEIPEVYAGHEIACHMAHHPTSARCPLPSITRDLLDDWMALEAITGTPVRGLAYPNGSHSPAIRSMLSAAGIRYARSVGSSESFSLPEDLTCWQSTFHHNHRLMELGRQFCDLHKTQYLYLMDVWGHSYEFDQDDNWELMETFCAMMGNREDIWYATHIEIVDYMEVFQRLQFAADNSFVYNPSVDSAWLSVGPGRIVEIPGGQFSGSADASPWMNSMAFSRRSVIRLRTCRLPRSRRKCLRRFRRPERSSSTGFPSRNCPCPGLRRK